MLVGADIFDIRHFDVVLLDFEFGVACFLFYDVFFGIELMGVEQVGVDRFGVEFDGERIGVDIYDE